MFSNCQIFLAVKTVFQSSGNVFFNEFFIPASANRFSVWGKQHFFIESFAEVFEIRGVATFFKEKPYSCLWKLIFWLAEVNFFHFSDIPASESYFPSSGNLFSNKFFIWYGGGGFSVL